MPKCGECLIDRVEIVELVNNVCPTCGADYRDHLLSATSGVDAGKPYEIGNVVAEIRPPNKGKS